MHILIYFPPPPRYDYRTSKSTPRSVDSGMSLSENQFKNLCLLNHYISMYAYTNILPPVAIFCFFYPLITCHRPLTASGEQFILRSPLGTKNGRATNIPSSCSNLIPAPAKIKLFLRTFFLFVKCCKKHTKFTKTTLFFIKSILFFAFLHTFFAIFPTFSYFFPTLTIVKSRPSYQIPPQTSAQVHHTKNKRFESFSKISTNIRSFLNTFTTFLLFIQLFIEQEVISKMPRIPKKPNVYFGIFLTNP